MRDDITTIWIDGIEYISKDLAVSQTLDSLEMYRNWKAFKEEQEK